MSERDYWIAFNMISGIGTGRFLKLWQRFGSAQKAWQAGADELAGVGGMPPALAADIVQRRSTVNIDKELKEIEQRGFFVMTLADENYPRLLREIYNPPMVLYVWGNMTLEDEKAIAIVGSRRATRYGKETAAKIAAELTGAGITVVSGMAAGIDSFAHQASIEAGGRTLAILGCGLDIVYPRQNGHLMQQIAAHGAVISEFPLGTQPEAYRFPRRNRIISGLSLGTVVIEAAQKSGSLITADFALEQGRDVFAVPGRVDAQTSKGTHALIKQGAKLVENGADILEEIGITDKTTPSNKREINVPDDLSSTEKGLARLLLEKAQSLDELSRRSGLTVSDTSTALFMLEMKGLVRQLPGKYFEWVQ